MNHDEIRDHIMSSPHLFSARHNRDFETMATHANEHLKLDPPINEQQALEIVGLANTGPGAAARAHAAHVAAKGEAQGESQAEAQTITQADVGTPRA